MTNGCPLVSELARRWQDAGVLRGDTVLLHSDVRRTLVEARRAGIALSPGDILASFLEALGPQGTLLLPLFNFDFAKGVPFDIRSSPSHMGALTEAGRLDPRSIRTGHPIYSFSVIGAQSGRFDGLDNQSGYSNESPFGMLRRLGGKLAVLDLDDQNSMTFYHHVEELKQVSYRYFKNFTAPYTDSSGNCIKRTYSLYVRDLNRGVETDVNPAGELLWHKGLYKGERPKTGSGLRTVDANAMFDCVAEIIDSGQALGMLYSENKNK